MWVSQLVSFPQVSPPKLCTHFSSPHTCYMPLPTYSRYDHRPKLGEEYRSLSSSLCSFLHSPVTWSLLGPNFLFNTMFANTLSLRSSLNARDQVSNPYKTTGKIIVLCILILIFMENKLEDKIFCTKWMIASFPWLQSALNFFLNIILFR